MPNFSLHPTTRDADRTRASSARIERLGEGPLGTLNPVALKRQARRYALIEKSLCRLLTAEPSSIEAQAHLARAMREVRLSNTASFRAGAVYADRFQAKTGRAVSEWH